MAGMDDWSPVETTLDEPVSETIRRDLREVGAKLKLVLLPRASQHGVLDRLKEWDLWGPLAVCLTLSIALSAGAPESQRALVFAAVFVVVGDCVEINQCVGWPCWLRRAVRNRHRHAIEQASRRWTRRKMFISTQVWAGAAIVTLNAQLLGGRISFFQSVCVLGYSIFPLDCGAFACLLLHALTRSFLLRLAVVGTCFAWSTRVSVVFFSEIIEAKRRALAIYPVFGFYAFLAWMILIMGN